MKSRILPLLFVFLAYPVIGQQVYRYTLDLKNCSNDQVKVVLQCPKIKEVSAVFVMPYVIPGSYAWKEYGRFLTEVKGFDASGNPIKIKRKKNQFYITEKADQLVRLEYNVNDTWDDSKKKDFVFQPGGSNIEENKNFVINHHAFEGYFQGYKNLPFEVEILHPESLYGSTWSTKTKIDKEKDLISAKNYFELVDNPVMYCVADTASFRLDSTRIHVSSYSANQQVRASSLLLYLKPLVVSLQQFIGKLPVKDYHFIFYFADPRQVPKIKKEGALSGFGALEHHHCSFYFLPEEKNTLYLKETVQEIAAHEFLHVLSPLNLHSKEISDFDFKDPRMSQHLWLYEGVTEYLSWLVRVQSGLVTDEEFIQDLKGKLEISDRYGLFSFTEMSKHVLEDSYKSKYADVYAKGAVLALLLDQLLLKESDGKEGLKHLIQKLMSKYGSERPFSDDSLFQEITAMTYPSVGEFFTKQVKNAHSMPMSTLMAPFGYSYLSSESFTCHYIAFFAYRINENGQLEVMDVQASNLDLKKGDIIAEVNGIKVTRQNFSKIEQSYFRFNRSPETVTLEIERGGRSMMSSGKPLPGTCTQKHVFQKLPLTEKTKYLHDAWLNGKYIK